MIMLIVFFVYTILMMSGTTESAVCIADSCKGISCVIPQCESYETLVCTQCCCCMRCVPAICKYFSILLITKFEFNFEALLQLISFMLSGFTHILPIFKLILAKGGTCLIDTNSPLTACRPGTHCVNGTCQCITEY